MVLTEFDESKYETMIREEEREEGRAEGKLRTLCDLVSDGLISMEEALKRADMTKQAFMEETMRFGINWDKK